MRYHLRKRGKSWCAVVSYKDSEGDSKQKWLTGPGRDEAEKKATRFLYDLDKGAVPDVSKMTLGSYLMIWLDEIRPNVAPRTYERYEGVINNYVIPDIGDILLQSLNRQALQKHLDDTLSKGLSRRTVNNHHVIIHHALKMAMKKEMVSRNVADLVTPPSFTRKEMQTWNVEELKQFLDRNKDNPFYPIFYLDLSTGLRRSELLGLQWGDVHLEDNPAWLSVQRGLVYLKDGSWVYSHLKTEKSKRTIPLPDSAAKLMRDYRWKAGRVKDKDRVFKPLNGDAWSHNRLTWEWKKACVKADVKIIRLHDARHTHATLLFNLKTPTKVVQERLGHSSISITSDIYQHVIPGMQEEATKGFDALIKG